MHLYARHPCTTCLYLRCAQSVKWHSALVHYVYDRYLFPFATPLYRKVTHITNLRTITIAVRLGGCDGKVTKDFLFLQENQKVFREIFSKLFLSPMDQNNSGKISLQHFP